MCQLITFAKCCSIFSLIGFIFLIIIGSLFEKQPMYLKATIDSKTAANSCFYAALIYAIFLILSVTYWFFYESIQQGRRFFGSSNNNNVVIENSGNEMIKFGTRYGAVASH